MAEKEQSDLVTEFRNVTSVDDNRALFYLEATGWDLKLAIQTYFEEMTGDDDDLYAEADSAQAPDPPVIQRTIPGQIAKPTAQYPKPTGTKPKVTTLSSLIQLEEDDSDDDVQAFYAGGSVRSGQQVLGPGKNKASDIAKNLFKAAESQGAEAVEHTKMKANKVTSFKGPGHVLGTQEIICDSASESQLPMEFTVTVWQNGFVVNNGPLRDFASGENSQFLAAIQKGQIPPELNDQASGRDLEIHLVDHSHEDFVPQTFITPFSGTGYRLGSPSASSVKKAENVDYNKSKKEAQDKLMVDASQPTTSVQVRLSDESRLVFTVNLNHTVGDIRQAILVARPEYSTASFALLVLFPTNELQDDLSIEKGALQNSVIMQRMRPE